MRREDWRRAYEPLPEALPARVAHTLSTLEEERIVKKHALRTAVIVCALLLALCGTALAVARQYGIGDFLNEMYGEQIPEQAQEIVDRPQASIQVEEVEASVREAVWDGFATHVVIEYRSPEGTAWALLDDPRVDLDALLAQYGTVYSPLDPDLVCIAEAGDEYFPESMGFEYQQEEENVLSMILSFDGKALPSRDLRYKVGYFRYDGAEEPDRVGGQGAGSAAFLEFELPDHTDLNETFTFDHPGALAGREIERATFTFTPLQTVVEVVYVDAKEDELVWADVDVLVLDEAGERIPATSTSLLSSGVDALEEVPDVLYLQAGDPSSNEGVGIGEPLAFTFK